MVLEPERYVSVPEALRWVTRRIRAEPRMEVIGARETYGRVLAQDVEAEHDDPPHDTSHMDGYAIRARDVATATKGRPTVLTLEGETKLGTSTQITISGGEAVRVSTGGALPRGADAIVPVEWAITKQDAILVDRLIPTGHFVYRAGTDFRAGRRVFGKGAVMRAQDVGILIHLGRAHVSVFRRPRVAIIATGNELTDDIGSKSEALVRNSHSQIFARLVTESGGKPEDMGIVRDNEDEISGKISGAWKNAELVLTLGGTSLGRLDLVERAIRRFVSSEEIIHGIRMDRGRVAGLAVIRGKPIIMMPGPVQGALNAFILFGLPLLRIFSGQTSRPHTFRAVLSEDWEARKRFANFTKVVYVRVKPTPSGLQAVPVVGDTESMTVLSDSNAFMVVPEVRTKIGKGEVVDVNLLPGFSYAPGQLLG